MKKLLATSAILLTAGSTAALAGTLEEPTVEAPVVYDAPATPTLDWTGFYSGAQLGYGDVNASGGLDGDGAIGGLHAGYLWDMGNYVVGGELDYDAADIDLGTTGDLDSVARAKLKVGYDAGQTLYYGILGAAYADADVGGTGLSDTGYVVGAGVDYQVAPQWVVGGEVLYHDFGDDFDNSGVSVDATTVQMRVSYKF